jgi:hypothetical protein
MIRILVVLFVFMIKGDQKVQKSKVLNFYLMFDLYLPRGFLLAFFYSRFDMFVWFSRSLRGAISEARS